MHNPKCDEAPGCGEWKRPFKANPEYKGKWYAPMIDNPAYIGEWAPRKIANPDYFEDLTPVKSLKPIVSSVHVAVCVSTTKLVHTGWRRN